MEKGGVIFFFFVVFMIVWYYHDANKHSGQTVLNTPAVSEQPRQPAGGPIDPNAIKNGMDEATKIAAAAPAVLAALNECPKPIPPEEITAFWEKESGFCPGLPVQKCAVSTIIDSKTKKPKIDPKTGKQVDGAHGPMQHMKSSSDTWGKAGENVEVLADALKMTVRHLCFAKDENNRTLEPASDAAIFRYNHSTEYVTSIRAAQAKHAAIWASIKSGNGPMVATLANTASPATTGVTHAVEGPPRTHLFAANPLKGFIKWFSAYANHRADGDRVYPHAGIDAGCLQRGQPVLSVCDGKVETSAELSDGRAGLTVIVACSDGMHKTSAMHLDTSVVSKGTSVRAGQEIGGCGTTGNAERGKSGPHVHFKLERLIAGVWTIVSPCAGMPNETVLNCGAMWGPNTDFAPLSTVVASN